MLVQKVIQQATSMSDRKVNYLSLHIPSFLFMENDQKAGRSNGSLMRSLATAYPEHPFDRIKARNQDESNSLLNGTTAEE